MTIFNEKLSLKRFKLNKRIYAATDDFPVSCWTRVFIQAERHNVESQLSRKEIKDLNKKFENRTIEEILAGIE